MNATRTSRRSREAMLAARQCYVCRGTVSDEVDAIGRSRRKILVHAGDCTTWLQELDFAYNRMRLLYGRCQVRDVSDELHQAFENSCAEIHDLCDDLEAMRELAASVVVVEDVGTGQA